MEQGTRVGIMRRISFPRGRSVIITAGVATVFPGRAGFSHAELMAADAGSGYGGRAAFLGGKIHTVTSGEGTILTTAGYTVT